MKKLFLLVITTLFAGSAWALGDNNAVELGLRAGVFGQAMELPRSMVNDTDGKTYQYSTEGAIGFHLGVVSRIRIADFSSGRMDMGFYFQPEIIYSQNNFKIQRKGYSENGVFFEDLGKLSKIRMQSIEVPVLLSFKVSILRAQFGPVFKAMYSTSTVGKGSVKMQSLRPLVGWSAGLSIDIIAGLVLDGRYNGQFKQLKNHISTDNTTYRNIRGRLASWSLGLSYLF